MAHPDFRVAGKIFATLGSPNGDWGMAALMPEQQEDFMHLAPDAFKPASGAWGRNGVHGPRRPVGSRSTTLAPTSAWPSPNTVAKTRTVSPTTALAGHRPQATTGSTSVMGMRPIIPANLPR